MKQFWKTYVRWTLILTIAFFGVVGAQVAFANLTLTNTKLSGDSTVQIDGPSSISIGASATTITIGNSNATTSFSGSVGVGTSTSVANSLLTIATTSNIMTVLLNGNIGIGTTTPSYILDVAGAAPPRITVGGFPFLYAPSGAGVGRNTFLGYKAGNAFLETDTGQANILIGDNAAPLFHGNEPNAHGNIVIGSTAASVLTNGTHNIIIGASAGNAITTNSGNVFVGYHTGINIDSTQNTAVGDQAFSNTGAAGTGASNTALGAASLAAATNGNNNVSVGKSSSEVLTTGGNNTILGTVALRSDISGSGNVALGFSAGRYELGSNAFYVNNVDESNASSDQAYSLLYGTFSGTATSLTGQKLVINGNVGIGTSTPSTGLHVVDPTNDSSTIRIGGSSKHACLEMAASSGTVGTTVYVSFDSNAVILATTTKPSFCQ